MSAGEPIDVLGADGRPLLDPAGRPIVKSRGAVHRDGDWHGAFHLWLLLAGGVLLQRRAAGRSSWPSRLDASAAGHLLAGEAPIDGIREAREELGVTLDRSSLVPLGTFTVDEPRPAGGFNREHQHLYGLRSDLELAELTEFDRGEVAALVQVGLADLTALIEHGRPVRAQSWDGEALTTVNVRGGELVPAPYLHELPALLGRL